MAQATEVDAARAAEAAGDHATAAERFERAGVVGAAVRCWIAASRHSRALALLLRISKDDPQYPRACALAIQVATALDHIDFAFDQFTSRYLSGEPRSDEEIEAFYRAGVLYGRHDMLDGAREALLKVVSARPGFADAEAQLAAVEHRIRGSAAEIARVVEEDAAFQRASAAPPLSGRDGSSGTFPSLPELPPPRSGRHGNERATVASSALEAKAPQGPAAHHQPFAPPGGRVEALLQNVFAVPAGITVAGRYKVENMLGRGGMAAVYRAKDLELDETIALKLFARDDDPTLVSRFKQELSLARQISHPNVIRLYDIGTHGSARFITMELLYGADMASRIEQGRDLLRDLGWLVQVCRGLGCVHERGVIHRDLKPENLFVTDDYVVKLMDFGIAKRRAEDAKASNLTRQGFTAGTPAYMAPEQINDFKSATHLSDLYSLGVIAYHLFTGVLPFDSESSVAVMMQHLREPPRPPSAHEPGIPDELEFLILQLLEKDPARRIQSCQELARDLEALRQRLLATKRRR